MALAVSRQLLTMEARVHSQFSSCRISGWQSGTLTGFFSCSSLIFPCQYHATMAPYSCIIWEINNRPIGGQGSETCHPMDMSNNGLSLDTVLSAVDSILK
jgi:hypothetical protein